MTPKWMSKTSEIQICYKILFYMCTLFYILTYLCNQILNFQCLRWQSLCYRLLHIPWGSSVPFSWYLARFTLSPNNVVSDHSGQPSAETSWLDSDSPSLMFVSFYWLLSCPLVTNSYLPIFYSRLNSISLPSTLSNPRSPAALTSFYRCLWSLTLYGEYSKLFNIVYCYP